MMANVSPKAPSADAEVMARKNAFPYPVNGAIVVRVHELNEYQKQGLTIDLPCDRFAPVTLPR